LLGVGGNARADARHEKRERDSLSTTVVAMPGAASLLLRTNRDDPRLESWLKQIALRAEQPVWRQWALSRAAR
jgi:hypothetical protein